MKLKPLISDLVENDVVNNTTDVKYNTTIEILSRVYNLDKNKISFLLNNYLDQNQVENTFCKVGDIIRKRNFEFFSREKNPFLKVKNIRKIKNGVLINETYNIINSQNIVIISEEESNKLLDIWNNCVLSETNNTEFSCVREDNGAKKVGYEIKNFKKVLFKYKVTRQEKFDAYVCNTCSKIHIGKSLN